MGARSYISWLATRQWDDPAIVFCCWPNRHIRQVFPIWRPTNRYENVAAEICWQCSRSPVDKGDHQQFIQSLEIAVRLATFKVENRYLGSIGRKPVAISNDAAGDVFCFVGFEINDSKICCGRQQIVTYYLLFVLT